MSEAEIGSTRKSLLNPELLKLYLATFLCFLFPLAAFFIFLLVCKTGTTVFKLNLGTERPALSEVVTQIDYCMRNIETPMTGIVSMLLWLTIPTYMITIKIT